MRSADQAPGMLPEAPTIAQRTKSRIRLPVAVQRRAELMLVALLAMLYAGSAGTFEPALAGRPGAVLTFLLALGGTAVVFLGTWDTMALLGLRRLLCRDREVLWRKYGRHRALQRRLNHSSFELDSELAGGLVTGVLRRFVALGRPEGDFLPRHLDAMLQTTRIGSTSLSFAATVAPILGLLGAVLGLAPGFRGMTVADNQPLVPVLEAASVPLGLGLGISVVAMVFSRLLGRCIVEECAAILAPVVEASREPISRIGYRVADRNEEACVERMQLWMAPPWSEELRRYRWATALVSWIATAGLILLIAHPS